MRRSFEKIWSYEREHFEPTEIKEAQGFLNELTQRVGEDLKERFPELPISPQLCRLKIEEFEELYPSEEFKKDLQKTYEIRKLQRIGRYLKEADKPGSEYFSPIGELAEKMINAVLWKALRNREIIVVGTTEFDDGVNKVDTLIVDSKEGLPICTIDDVADAEGERFKEKIEQVRRLNLKGGARVKYGIDFENGKLIKTKLTNLPQFYLAVAPANVMVAPEKMSLDLEKLTPYEQGMLQVLRKEIIDQLRLLEILKNPKYLKDYTQFERFKRRLEKAEEIFTQIAS